MRQLRIVRKDPLSYLSRKLTRSDIIICTMEVIPPSPTPTTPILYKCGWMIGIERISEYQTSKYYEFYYISGKAGDNVSDYKDPDAEAKHGFPPKYV